jgi:Transcriptional regulator, AbiEi antitoxin, Type IV TA system/Transcriptional regulator, AbiEi antitoxin N-terminal domain
MRQQNHGKLNWLQHHLPDGLVVDAAWLESHGYSSALRSKYAARGWLDQVARGVYRRPPDQLPAPNEDEGLHWQHVVISLQTLLERPLIVGGRTALELQGFAHYLSATGPREVHLYGDEPPPGWVAKLKLETRFVFHNAKKLFKNAPIARGLGALSVDLRTRDHVSTDPIHGDLVRQPWGQWNWPFTLSSPERAILELLDEVPQRETFHQADVLMEGLRNLSPRRLHKLLVDCRSVKVKRLFLWFAERQDHAWLKQLDRKDIDLGHGKRMLVRGGKLDPKFNITVPENLDAGG